MARTAASTSLILVVILVCLVLLVLLVQHKHRIPSDFATSSTDLRWRSELRAEPSPDASHPLEQGDDDDEEQVDEDYEKEDDNDDEMKSLQVVQSARSPRGQPAFDWARVLQLTDEAAAHDERLRARARSHFVFEFRRDAPDDVVRAFDFAGRIVSAHFEALPVPVRVAVEWLPLGPEVLAHAGPTAFYKVAASATATDTANDIGGHGHEAVWLPKALMNQRVRRPPPDEYQPDMVLTVNAKGAWYVGLEGRPPPGHYDLVTVVIHELQHGLGFLSMIGQGGSAGGSLANGLTAFVNGQAAAGGGGSSNGGLESRPETAYYVFDRFVHIVGSGHVFAAANKDQGGAKPMRLVWASPSFANANTNEVAGAGAGVVPELYVPRSFEGSSSVSHLDEATYPPGSPSALMTPILAKQEVIHNMGGLLIKMFGDMGWPMRDCTRYRSCGACVANLCRWCYDPLSPTAAGECGDPGAAPFFNAECRRPNSTDVFNDYCSFEVEEEDQDKLQVPKEKEKKEGEEGGEDEQEQQGGGEETMVVVAKAANECHELADCAHQHRQRHRGIAWSWLWPVPPARSTRRSSSLPVHLGKAAGLAALLITAVLAIVFSPTRRR